MSKSDTSIIICGYKYLNYKEVIFNNLKLIPSSWEIIFVDNNENLEDLKVIKNFLFNHNFQREIKFINCPIAGVGPSRDYGFRHSTFETIIYLDVDDFILETKNLIQIVKEHKYLHSDLTLSPCKHKKNSKSKPSFIPKKITQISFEDYLFQRGQYNIIVSRKVLENLEWGYYYCKAELAGQFIIKCFQKNYKICISNISIIYYNEIDNKSIIRSPIDNTRCNELSLIHINSLIEINKIKKIKKINFILIKYKIFLIFKIIYYGIIKSSQPYFYFDSKASNKYFSIKLIYFFVCFKLFINKIKRKIS